MNPIIIIPALDPDERLLKTAEALLEKGGSLLVVDDGSGPESGSVFEVLAGMPGCTVLRHAVNRGKGAALKTAFRHVAENHPGAGCVTADADGQHDPEDIRAVARELEAHPDALVLGVRSFKGKGVPFRSLFGNRITSLVYLLSTGRRCADTQTGLRGIPAGVLEACITLPGEHFEYEINQLMELGREGLPFRTVPIRTIYHAKNETSHFKPLQDSLKIYWNILKFSLSGLLSAGADLLLFALLARSLGSASGGILLATAGARVASGLLNYSLNKHWVFGSPGSHRREGLLYLGLFLCQMLASGLLVSAFSVLPVPLLAVKVLVDGCLFLISYRIQKKYVFRKPDSPASK